MNVSSDHPAARSIRTGQQRHCAPTGELDVDPELAYAVSAIATETARFYLDRS